MVWAQDDIDNEPKALSDPFQQFSSIATIDPDTAQLFATPRQCLQQPLCTITILYAG
jgi:hypothetical protein